MKCAKCEAELPEVVEKFSKDRYGQALCRDCQKTARPVEEKQNTAPKRDYDRSSRQATLNTACKILEISESSTNLNVTELLDNAIKLSDLMQHYVKTGENLLAFK